MPAAAAPPPRIAVGRLQNSGSVVMMPQVPSDPVSYPGNRWYVGPVRDQVAAKIAETVDGALQRRASDLAVNCQAPLQWTHEWLDCWARVRLWAAGKRDLDPLLRLVGMIKDQRRGPLWEQVRCAR